jgi:Tol biopolymer transport system component
MVSRDGGTVEQAQLPASSSPDDPQWSPDGKSLLFALYPPGIFGKPRDFSVAQYDLQRENSLPSSR